MNTQSFSQTGQFALMIECSFTNYMVVCSNPDAVTKTSDIPKVYWVKLVYLKILQVGLVCYFSRKEKQRQSNKNQKK